MRIRLLAGTLALLLASALQAQAPAPAASPAATPAPTTFVVKFKVKPGQNAAFENALLEMQDSVRKHEPGNVYYDFFRDPASPQVYVIIERYKDQAAVTAHGQSEHAKKVIATIRDMLDGTPEAQRFVLIQGKE